MKSLLILLLSLLISLPTFADEGTDAYDPFIDYSEYEDNSDEEADINFFRNGRFFTLGLTVGQKVLTQGMREVWRDGTHFGLFLSYFFDLRFALQIGYSVGSHPIDFTAAGKHVTGDTSIQVLSANLKYYVNTQNVTRGLAAINPYLTAGFANVTRDTSVDGQPAFTKDSSTGFEAGLGLEIPMLRNKMFLGAQATYQIVNFAGENSELYVDNGSGQVASGIIPSGDFINFNVILGINF